jgi:CHAT domain-containing protein
MASILESNARQLTGLPDSVIEKENYLKTQLAETEIKILQINASTPQSQKLEYEKQYHECFNQLENYIKGIEKRFPDYYHLKYKPLKVTLSDIQKKLSSGTMMISYAKTEKHLYLICITKKNVFMEEKPLSEDFNGYITAFRRAIKNKLPDYAWKPDAKYLGTILFPSQMPSDISNIIIVHEDVMLKIPFECLILPSNATSSLWIQKYAITYAYSCKLWYEMEQRTYFVPYSFTAITPVFNTKESIRLANDMLVEGLPATIEESNYISQLFLSKSMPTQVFFAQDAQETIIKQQLHQTRFLHFATHGYFDATNAGLSCIMLYPSVTNEEDGILYTKEIYNLSVKAELVVLSACETGLGKVFRGEGTMGLTRAWLYAGAKYVLASLWRVNDKATATLMTTFYFYLIQKKQSIETALHKAKLKTFQNPEYQHPYYWSSFVLIE